MAGGGGDALVNKREDQNSDPWYPKLCGCGSPAVIPGHRAVGRFITMGLAFPRL